MRLFFLLSLVFLASARGWHQQLQCTSPLQVKSLVDMTSNSNLYDVAYAWSRKASLQHWNVQSGRKISFSAEETREGMCFDSNSTKVYLSYSTVIKLPHVVALYYGSRHYKITIQKQVCTNATVMTEKVLVTQIPFITQLSTMSTLTLHRPSRSLDVTSTLQMSVPWFLSWMTQDMKEAIQKSNEHKQSLMWELMCPGAQYKEEKSSMP